MFSQICWNRRAIWWGKKEQARITTPAYSAQSCQPRVININYGCTQNSYASHFKNCTVLLQISHLDLPQPYDIAGRWGYSTSFQQQRKPIIGKNHLGKWLLRGSSTPAEVCILMTTAPPWGSFKGWRHPTRYALNEMTPWQWALSI